MGFSDLTAPGGDLRLFNKFGSDAYMKEGWFRKEQVISTRPREDIIMGQVLQPQLLKFPEHWH
ncbi:hypothetical protein ACQKFK_22220 [Bacillus mycoides]|uniref:hypothetical protein n=1 Tax=Bacillus mycoides TaxID=1405 RepID=UPI003CFFA54E